MTDELFCWFAVRNNTGLTNPVAHKSVLINVANRGL
jgi:hypothetical protein